MNINLNIVSNLDWKEFKVNINEVRLRFLRKVIVIVCFRELMCIEWTLGC